MFLLRELPFGGRDDYACIKISSGINFRPHRSTMYELIDAACGYRSSVVCRSVCRSVTAVSPAKTAQPIVMPFELRTRVGPRNHALDGVQIPSWEGAILQRLSAVGRAKTSEPIGMPLRI